MNESSTASPSTTPTRPLSAEERQEQLAIYRAGYDTICSALEGIGEDELDAREALGEWSPREVVHHMADSEMTSAVRMRLLIAEDGPHIVAYDQEEFAAQLFYTERPIEASLQAFRYARETAADIAERLTDEQWLRSGTHSESGTYGLQEWLLVYADHAVIHADQIQRARAAYRNGTSA